MTSCVSPRYDGSDDRRQYMKALPVHGLSQGGVSLNGETAEAHGTGVEPLNDGSCILYLRQIHRVLALHDLQLAP